MPEDKDTTGQPGSVVHISAMGGFLREIRFILKTLNLTLGGKYLVTETAKIHA